MASLSTVGPLVAEERTSEQEFTLRDAIAVLSREERFMGTVNAMNTLLIRKGFYSQQEFDSVFCRWAKTQLSRPSSERPGKRSFFARLFR